MWFTYSRALLQTVLGNLHGIPIVVKDNIGTDPELGEYEAVFDQVGHG